VAQLSTLGHTSIMKILPFVLLFAITGCSRPENPATQVSREIQQWIPVGTPLVAAQKILEQHQYVFSIDSYANQQEMNGSVAGSKKDSSFDYWHTGVFRNGKTEAVTNICILSCRRIITGDQHGDYHVTLRSINGQIEGPVTVVEVVR